MRIILAILITKISHFLLALIGKGSSKPGELALMIYPEILKEIRYPKRIVAVTGTTGKTSTTMMLNKIINESGMTVGHNLKGSNLIQGIATTILNNSDIFGNFKRDILLLEVDERYAKLVFDYFSPTDFMVTNLSRDQLVRNIHHEYVYEDVKKVINDEMTLYLNVDNPLCNKFSIDHKGQVKYVGVNKNELSTMESTEVLDIAYCPSCGEALTFESFNYGNLSDYKCKSCEFKRYQPHYAVTDINLYGGEITVNREVKLPLINKAFYNIYNIVNAYAIANSLGINDETIIKALNSKGTQERRFDEFEVNGRKGVMLLSKNETPISYNQSIRYVKGLEGKKTVLLGFDNVSGRYKEKDLSWLYDIDFEELNSDDISNIVCIGRFANNIAVRLKYSGISESKIIIEPQMRNIKSTLKETVGYICAVLYFDTYQSFSKVIGGEK